MNHDFTAIAESLEYGTDEQRIAALRSMRDIIDDGEPEFFFDLAERLIASANNDVRWQALIVIGEYIPSGKKNDSIWKLILHHLGKDEDMQDALATVLLEHLLEYDFDHTIVRIRSELKNGNALIVDLLEGCWPFGQAEGKWNEVQDLLRLFH